MLTLLAALCFAPAAELTLSKTDASQGWVRLFDGETTYGWKIDGDVKVENGEMTIGGGKAVTAHATPIFDNFAYRVEAAWEGHQPPRIESLMDHAGVQVILWQGSSLAANAMHKKEGHIWTLPREKRTIQILVPANSKLRVRRLEVRPIGNEEAPAGKPWSEMTPLFNGKDLAGWRVHPGDRYKSKFSVTSEGWLNLKNGPGDVQTEKQFADFVLQAEVKTNGVHLNSGIFFRCLPNQYQQGYEVQINNKCDKTIDKPSDFGTGAIYRRVSARKVVSKDREWFTVTLLARGNRITTWVDGYMTVDWLDERPKKENPREGCRTSAGCVSLQGHDPTTDIDFRNLRIVELIQK